MSDHGRVQTTPAVTDSLMAERFLGAWRDLESALEDRWRRARRGTALVPDSTRLLEWARQGGMLTPETEAFLHNCRRARNAYVHVSFEGYRGPVALPPLAIVHRLERIATGVRNPPQARSAAVKAVMCERDTPLRLALARMRQGDFSQLPYLSAIGEWLLVTREQVARYVEAETDSDGQALLDLNLAVSTLAEHPAVGIVRPRVLPLDRPLFEVVRELELALHTPDHEDFGYPAVLLVEPTRLHAPRILAADDLPKAYRALGRS